MKRTRREILGVVGLGVLLVKLPSALDASDKPEPPRNDDGLYTQPWFHESFLDLRDDLAEAEKAGKSLAVLFEQRGCPYCRETHVTNLSDPETAAYIQKLSAEPRLIGPYLSPDTTRMSWFVFVVRLNDLFEPGDRDAVMTELRSENIGCNNYFPPIHLQPYIMEMLGTKPGDYPVCEYVSARTLALPFFSRMTTRQVNRVCDVLEKVLEKSLVGRKGRF